MIWQLILAINKLSQSIIDNSSQQHKLFQLGEQLMSELDDLRQAMTDITAAVSANSTAVTDASAELKSLADQLKALAGQGTINPADIETIAQAAEAQASALASAAQALETSVADAQTEVTVTPTPVAASAPGTVSRPAVPPVTPVAAVRDPVTGEIIHG